MGARPGFQNSNPINQTSYDYDLLDNLIGVTFTNATGEQNSVGFTYDALGQLLSETTACGTVQHRYDELGNLIQTQTPDGRWINRLLYGSGHLHQINLDGQVICDFERDRLHRELLRTQGQMNTRSEYDRIGRLRLRTRRLNSLPRPLPAESIRSFEFDRVDNLTARVDSHRQGDLRTLFGYDSSGRITSTQNSQVGQLETFAYDAAANLMDGKQSSVGRVAHNRLLTYKDKRYRYDGFGRLIEKRSIRRGTQHFTYDVESRLIEVRNPNGHIVRMTYDPLGRRTAKTEHHPSGYPISETKFTWDGLRLLLEEQNTLPTLYLYADQSHEPVARVDGRGEHQKIRYYHNDLNGLPEQLTEPGGQIIWQARYQVWGNTLEETREPYFVENQNLRFQGQYLDRETGLHYNTFRFYDPDVGRFTTPDPIGLAGGLNLYQYAPNPVGWVDPWGWSCVPNKKTSYQAKSRREAFRQAKRDADIPLTQNPSALTRPNLLDENKRPIIKGGSPLETRQYEYRNNRGEVVLIQEHSLGHKKATQGHGAEPHFNVRPAADEWTGHLPGTHGHYNF